MTRRERVILVEDDESLREVMCFHLEEAGHAVLAVAEAESALSAYDPETDVVITDLRMPGMDGMALLGRLKQRDEQAVVLVITAYGGTDRAVEAMRRGAFHYVEKPVNTTTLLSSVGKALEHLRRKGGGVELASQHTRAADAQSPIVASSPRINQVLRLVDKIAPTDATVLLRGESGTGKELIARAIHARSPRAGRPFVPVNCAAIPPDLLESALFGHEKGAFTGASRTTEGRFRQANGGTIFLDEIAELPTHLQPKLLRVLQEGEVEVVGAARPAKVDVRVIAATHQDLEALLERGALRQDLYYRLNVVPIEIPPLRERPEDIPTLTRFFMRKVAPQAPLEIDREVDEALLSYAWPGNVRELQNVIERMVFLREGERLTAADLPPFVLQPRAHGPGGLPFALPEAGLDLIALEKAIIEAALARCEGNRSATARYLNIPRHVLIYRLEKFGIK